MEAFEHNGMDLPKEYLLAKLAFTKDPADQYRDYMTKHGVKDADRRNTGFHFEKADLYNSTAGSFNKMLESDRPYEDVDEGLAQILDDFLKKAEFLQAVKANNTNPGRELTDTREVLREFALGALDYGHLPLPVL